MSSPPFLFRDVKIIMTFDLMVLVIKKYTSHCALNTTNAIHTLKLDWSWWNNYKRKLVSQYWHVDGVASESINPNYLKLQCWNKWGRYLLYFLNLLRRLFTQSFNVFGYWIFNPDSYIFLMLKVVFFYYFFISFPFLHYWTKKNENKYLCEN